MDLPERGLIIGKFLPMHKGHQYLIECAAAQVQKLTVLVCSLQREPIPGEIRFQWVKSSFPNVRVLHVRDENPQEPHENPNFWEIWKDTIFDNHPEKIDILFTSESYGGPLAEALSCKHIAIDEKRQTFPISGTQVRENPWQNWQFLPEMVRPYFVKTIVIYGSESTGKTTLAEKLARHFRTQWVPEFAREYLPTEGVDLDSLQEKHFVAIAHGQRRAVQEKIPQARRFLFCDTDVLTTKIYADHYLGYCPSKVLDLADAESYDAYLVLNIDIPWIDDSLRDIPHEREKMHALFLQELEMRKIPYHIISGDFTQRLETAIRLVEEI
ncbi:MAG: AAA family ATPase [Spirochaetota bacterium]